MADWQRRMWQEVMAIPGVVPPAGGALLAMGGEIPEELKGVVVRHVGWGEKIQGELSYDRVLLVADNSCKDFAVVLEQAGRLVSMHGLLVVVASRPWPFGNYGTRWSGGKMAWRWRRWLRAAGWVIEKEGTAGGLLNGWGGCARVVLARQKHGGNVVVLKTKPVVAPVGAVGV